MSLLPDLARRTVFLPAASVTGGLEDLLDPKRGEEAPHSFNLQDKDERASSIGILQNLDTD